MPYDPTKPANGTPLNSAEMRNQLNALKAISDGLQAVLNNLQAQLSALETQVANIPAGPQGEKGDKGDTGDQGPPFAQAVVDGVNTGGPGSAAGVGVSFDGTNVHFTFDIPRGDKGDQGDPGEVTQAALDADIAGTARNPSGQMGNLDPNWTPSGDTNADMIWLRDRLVELYNAEAR